MYIEQKTLWPPVRDELYLKRFRQQMVLGESSWGNVPHQMRSSLEPLAGAPPRGRPSHIHRNTNMLACRLARRPATKLPGRRAEKPCQARLTNGIMQAATSWCAVTGTGADGTREKCGRINNATDIVARHALRGLGTGWGAPRTGLPLSCGVSRMGEKTTICF
jgi:hypothetical protein